MPRRVLTTAEKFYIDEHTNLSADELSTLLKAPVKLIQERLDSIFKERKQAIDIKNAGYAKNKDNTAVLMTPAASERADSYKYSRPKNTGNCIKISDEKAKNG